MDFVYVDDVARANILAMRVGSADDVYNVASGTETSLLGLWQAIQRVTGAYHLDPEFHPPRKVNPVPRRLADTRAGAARSSVSTREVTLDGRPAAARAWRLARAGDVAGRRTGARVR